MIHSWGRIRWRSYGDGQPWYWGFIHEPGWATPFWLDIGPFAIWSVK